MNELITGYNALHLKNFNEAELNALANYMIEKGEVGLTYRLYGGGNVTDFVLNEAIGDFLVDVEGDVVLTSTETNGHSLMVARSILGARGIATKSIQWRNELYLFDEPVWWRNFWEWRKFTFAKKKYYRDLAIGHINEWGESTDTHIREVINLPLKVNQNVGFKAYAEEWLKYLGFDISLHVYGVPTDILMENLMWYKQNTNRTIHIYEFNGLKNQRDQPYRKNGYNHKHYHNLQLETIHDVLGDQLGDILYFTLAGNDTTASWEEPPFLHKYRVKNRTIPGTIEYEHDGLIAFFQIDTGDYGVINTIENVWT